MNNQKLTVGELQRIIANPFYAINISPVMCVEHEPLTDEETFIKAGVKSIEENGAENFLRNLLENLKGNFIASPDDESVVDGFKKNELQ